MIKLEELQSMSDRIDGFYMSLKARGNELATEVQSLKEDTEITQKASIVLKHLLDSMVKEDISKMANLVTYGLKTIFDDQDLSFIPNIVKKNDKIWIELKTRNKGIEGEIDSFGGSVAVIEGFLLRIICIMKMNLARFIRLDETFAAVGDSYIPNTSRLISELSKKLNLDVLLVTHQKDFQTYADNVYNVIETPNGLKMEKMK